MDSKLSLRTREVTPQAMGFGTWFALYFGGAFLIVFLLAHLWVVHTASAEGPFTFQGVIARVRAPLFFVLDLGLLLLSVYHGLAGLRRVILDLDVVGPGGQRYLQWVLVLLGVALVAIGVRVILLFAAGN